MSSSASSADLDDSRLMINLHRIDGSQLIVNSDLILTLEQGSATVITLLDGSRYIVVESAEIVIDLVINYKAALLRLATADVVPPSLTSTVPHSGVVHSDNVAPLHGRRDRRPS